MDLARKIEIVKRDIEYIARADDTDSALRSRALDAVDEFIKAERVAMQERLDAHIATKLPK